MVIVKIACSPNKGIYITLLAKSHDPPSSLKDELCRARKGFRP